MNVVDSSAWLAYFRNESNAESFAQPIENVGRLLVPSITLTEVFKFSCRNLDEHHALEAISQMQEGTVVPLGGQLALDAARFGMEFQLPLADSIIYATARKFDAVLWTQDADFEGLPGVRCFLCRE